MDDYCIWCGGARFATSHRPAIEFEDMGLRVTRIIHVSCAKQLLETAKENDVCKTYANSEGDAHSARGGLGGKENKS